ncbi:GMP synthase - Glutamine amidotransferase domain [Prochlorococcus marinus str. SS51]|nr:GMP synthase - Glutamine amidotransferase domain [Prochlorococcus marinus str. SS51]
MGREGPGLFAKVALQRGMNVIICRLDLGDAVPDLLEEDVLLILGGPMGLRDMNNDNYPWLLKEISLLQVALQKKIPVIGVCLGAQLLAYAAGGKVERLTLGKNKKEGLEVGWGSIYFINANNPFNFSGDLRPKVLHWHGDRIILPEGAQLIASSDICAEQFFCIPPCSYGIQFHVEIEEHIFSQWISEDKEFIQKAFGDKASTILKQQQKKFGAQTLNHRINFIDKLYEVLEL